MFKDNISEKRILTLHPLIRHEVLTIFNKANNEILTGKAKARVTQAYRSIKEQNDLYAQGRTKAGKIVTNAKGGYSMHNFGLAFDFCLIVDGKYAVWDTRRDFDGDMTPDWMEFVRVFKEAGYEWGGDRQKFKDYPHLQKVFGKSTSDLRRAKKDSHGFVIL